MIKLLKLRNLIRRYYEPSNIYKRYRPFIDLPKLADEYRMQRIIFEAARDIFDQMDHEWKGNREDLIGQLIREVEKVIYSDVIQISPPLFNSDDIRRCLMITLNMNKVVNHIWRFIRQSNSTRIIPVFDTDKPIRSTSDMRTWFTSKPCDKVKKSHINFCVFDSTWESSAAVNLDNNPSVAAWVKNDHLGFQIPYVYQGIVHNYLPDYIIKLINGVNLIIEVKGEESQQDKVKVDYLRDWCKAINDHGGFGTWISDVAFNPDHIEEIIKKQI